MKLNKIIIFYPSFEKGGVEKILVNLINFILTKNYEIILISSNFKKQLIKKKKNFKYVNLNSKKNIFLNDRISRSFSAYSKLREVLKEQKKDNFIVFSLQSSILAIIACKILGHRHKVVVRNAEDPIYSAIYAENKIISYFVLFLKLIFYNFSDGIITNSKGSKLSLNKFLLNKNIEAIYNPYLKKKSNRNKKKRSNIILSVGRLTKQKDFRSLIFAFYKIKDKIINYNLIIIGEGELKNSLIKLTKDLKIDKRVKFLGWRNKLEKYYKKSKLFVLSSLYEGLGNVLIDAINYEVPIVTTNCKSGPSEIINNKKGGYLSLVSDSDDLSKKILFALKNYNLSKKKILFAKKNINRFLKSKNSLKYLEYIEKVFYEKK